MMAMMTAMEDVTVAKEAIKVSNESNFPYFSVKKHILSGVTASVFMELLLCFCFRATVKQL